MWLCPLFWEVVFVVVDEVVIVVVGVVVLMYVVIEVVVFVVVDPVVIVVVVLMNKIGPCRSWTLSWDC